MIICEECGSANEAGGQFCGSCGAYLDWSGSEAEGATTAGQPVADEPADSLLSPLASGVTAAQHASVGSPGALAAPPPTPQPSGPGDAAAASQVRLGESPAEPTAQARADQEPASPATPADVEPPAPAPQEPAEEPAGTGSATAEEPSVQGSASGEEAPVQGSVSGEEPPGRAATAGLSAAGPARSEASPPVPPTPSAAPTSADASAAAAEASRHAAAAAMRRPVKPAAPAPRPPAPAPAPAPTPAAPPAAEAAARQPTARKPGEAAPRRAAATAPVEDEPAARPGDLICGRCGAGNDPTRKFCRRCGNSLEAAVVVPELPWWKRIFRRAPKQAQAAGSRPTRLHADTQRRTSAARRWVTVLVVLGVVAAALWWLRPFFGSGVDWVGDRLSSGKLQEVSGVEASASARNHPAELTVDGTSNTYWAPPRASKPVGQHLDYQFDQPFRLIGLTLVPGAAKDDQAAFLAQGRPTSVEVVVRTSDGERTSRTWDLPSQAGSQALALGINDVTDVRITIRGSVEGTQGRLVAIAEVEFRTRS